jgi:hypothetical protein
LIAIVASAVTSPRCSRSFRDEDRRERRASIGAVALADDVMCRRQERRGPSDLARTTRRHRIEQLDS